MNATKPPRGPLSEEERDILESVVAFDMLDAEKERARFILDLDTALRAALKERDEAQERYDVHNAYWKCNVEIDKLRVRLAEVEKERKVAGKLADKNADSCAALSREIDRLRTLAAKQEAEGAEMRQALLCAEEVMDLEDITCVQVRGALTSTTLGTAALACVEALERTIPALPSYLGEGETNQNPCLRRIADEALLAFRRATGQESA